MTDDKATPSGETVERDAARYRWLRANIKANMSGWTVRMPTSDPLTGIFLDVTGLDRAIDTAMAKEKP